MEHDEITSPTISMEGTLLTTVIEAQEGQDITTSDIPNTFCPDSCGREGQRWKSNHHEDKRSLCGHPLWTIYWDYTVTEGNQKVLYVHIT